MEKIDPSKAIAPMKGVDDLVEEAIDSLRADKKVYAYISETLKLSMGEVKANLPALLDYQEDVNYCAHCPGLSKCAKATPCFVLKLEKADGILYRHLDPCEKKSEAEDFAGRYLLRDFPDSYASADLKNVEKSKASREEVILRMTKMVLNKTEDWVYITGNRGAGKSYLLAAFANSFSKKKAPVAYADTAALIDKLKELNIKDKTEYGRLFDELVSCPLLVLDDFGNEFKSEFVFASILFPLINERAKAKKATAFASDFSISDIYLMYKDKVGVPRARQLSELLKSFCKKEFDVSGVSLH